MNVYIVATPEGKAIASFSGNFNFQKIKNTVSAKGYVVHQINGGV